MANLLPVGILINFGYEFNKDGVIQEIQNHNGLMIVGTAGRRVVEKNTALWKSNANFKRVRDVFPQLEKNSSFS